MRLVFRLFALLSMIALAACGGGGGSAGTSTFGGGSSGGGTGGTATPSVAVVVSNSTVTSAAPATVTALVKDAKSNPVVGTVVTFSTANNKGSFSSTTALTDANGQATVTLSPASSTASGADTVVADATVNGTAVTGSVGFSLVSTSASITSFTSATGNSAATPLSAYGQTVLTLALSGASTSNPVTLSLSSSCVAAGKATLSPSSVTATSSPVIVTYKDTGGCGSTLATDTVTASISGTATQSQVQLYLSSPQANNIVFVSASPQTIYLAGSGLTTSSQVVFQVNDRANNPLPNQSVTLGLSTFAGGLTIEGAQSNVTQTTDSNGRVTVLVNSGTVPTPVRVTASLAGGISTVSSNLSVAVGLPSQLNFSLSQATINIEGYNYDGTSNTYTVYAADRSGNPVPNGTTINFWAEGGQVASSAQTAVANGIASASVAYVSQAPRPADGHVTIVAYAIGEESFIDQNGNNVWDTGEPFQDLGDIVKDKLFDNSYDANFDEIVSLSGVAAGSSACVDSSGTYAILKLVPDTSDALIPSRPGTCDGTWTARTYVRRAVETVLSTSTAQALWADPRFVDSASGSCVSVTKNVGPSPGSAAVATPMRALVGGTTVQTGARAGSLAFYASDDNPVRFNPMPAGTTVTATALSTGLTTNVAGGSPVASTANPFPLVGVTFSLTNTAVTPGVFALNFTTPKGTTTSYTISIDPSSTPASPCN